MIYGLGKDGGRYTPTNIILVRRGGGGDRGRVEGGDEKLADAAKPYVTLIPGCNYTGTGGNQYWGRGRAGGHLSKP